jgi:glycosyltransferase involved in cell wall biosynthesis
MAKKKVIHLITTIERGGAENQLLILVREQIEKNLDIEIFYLKGKPELEEKFLKLGARVDSLLANKNFMMQILLFRRFINRSNFLVHTHLAQAELLASIVCERKKFIISRHNFEPFWPNKPKFVSRALSRYTSNKAIACIAISNAVKEYLLSHKEINRRIKIYVIHYGFERTSLQSISQPKIIISELTNKEIFKIGTIGRLVPGKNFLTMFKSLKLVAETIPNIKMFIVGAGKSEGELKKVCKEMQIENYIIWMGKTGYIQEFLNQIDLFVFASEGEGFGLVLLEAMQANKPILAPNNSAIPEVLGVSYPGLYPTGDHRSLAEKILSINNNSKAVKELTSGYKSQLKLFDSKIMANKIMQVYESIGF